MILFVPSEIPALYSGDYLASLLLIYGALLLILNRSEARATFSLNIATKIAAAVLGIGTILAVGAWLNWQLTDWLAQCAEVAAVLRACSGALDFCLCGGGGARAREFGQAPDDSICACDGFAARDLARLRFCLLRTGERTSADSALGDRARNIFDLAAARYRCVTPAHRLRPGRRTLWCYTRRLVDCVGVPTNLTRGMKKIAIVGGGPAGALCGERLATAGFEVTIFDERLAWEKPCGGGLTHKAIETYPFLLDTPHPKKDYSHGRTDFEPWPSGPIRNEQSDRHLCAEGSEWALAGSGCGGWMHGDLFAGHGNRYEWRECEIVHRGRRRG